MKFNEITIKDRIINKSRNLEFGKLNLVIATNKKGKTLLYDALEVSIGSGDPILLKKGDYQITDIHTTFDHKNATFESIYDKDKHKYSFLDTTNNTKQQYILEYSNYLFGSEVLLEKSATENNSENFNINHVQKLIFSFFPETRVGDLKYPFPKSVANLKKRFQVGKVFKSTVAGMDNKYYESEQFLKYNSTISLEKSLKNAKDSVRLLEKSKIVNDLAIDLVNTNISIKELNEMKNNINTNSKLQNIKRILNLIKEKNKNSSNLELKELSSILDNIQNEYITNGNLIKKIDTKISSLESTFNKLEQEINYDVTTEVAKAIILKNEIKDIEKKINDENRKKREKTAKDIIEFHNQKLKSAIVDIEKIMKTYFSYCSDKYLKSLSISDKNSVNQFSISEKEDFGIITNEYKDMVLRYYDAGSHALKTVIQVCYILSLHQYLNKIDNNDFPFIVFDSISMPFSSGKSDESLDRNALFKDLCQIIKCFNEDINNEDSQIIIIDKTRDWDLELGNIDVFIDFKYFIDEGLLK